MNKFFIGGLFMAVVLVGVAAALCTQTGNFTMYAADTSNNVYMSNDTCTFTQISPASNIPLTGGQIGNIVGDNNILEVSLLSTSDANTDVAYSINNGATWTLYSIDAKAIGLGYAVASPNLTHIVWNDASTNIYYGNYSNLTYLDLSSVMGTDQASNFCANYNLSKILMAGFTQGSDVSLYASSDYGSTWVKVWNLSNSSSVYGQINLGCSPDMNTVYLSWQNQTSYNVIYQGSYNPTSMAMSQVYAVQGNAFDDMFTNGTIAFADYQSNPLQTLLSTDSGNSWNLINITGNQSSISSWSSMYGSGYAPQGNMIDAFTPVSGDITFYKSVDSGSTWTLMSATSIPDTGLYGFYIDPYVAPAPAPAPTPIPAPAINTGLGGGTVSSPVGSAANQVLQQVSATTQNVAQSASKTTSSITSSPALPLALIGVVVLLVAGIFIATKSGGKHRRR